MGRYEEMVTASVDQLESHGWVLGPPVEAEEWRRRVKAAARERRWRMATGIGPRGHPWAARTDLEDESGTPWYRLGVSVRSFFSTYPPA